MYKKLAILSATLLISACSGMDNTNQDIVKVSKDTLRHHNWKLVKIDGKQINLSEGYKAPTLEIGEKMSANGGAGCNSFSGQGELEKNQLRILNVIMTRKMCPENVMDIEMAYIKALEKLNIIQLTSNSMELKSEKHTLTFQLKDWVN
jgi:heat shock protein HslJ